ncbi:Uncharacterized protein APZ42_002593 [Daphnia magna]|uniref:Uncharacterized protein n=1 Tax=Daphnia magna TaxID=35525 RepID=A0A164I674_9CRUS|nr:Uncharacterized protein APZ42_002593 [Daphnia magna]
MGPLLYYLRDKENQTCFEGTDGRTMAHSCCHSYQHFSTTTTTSFLPSTMYQFVFFFGEGRVDM